MTAASSPSIIGVDAYAAPDPPATATSWRSRPAVRRIGSCRPGISRLAGIVYRPDVWACRARDVHGPRRPGRPARAAASRRGDRADLDAPPAAGAGALDPARAAPGPVPRL